MPDEDISTDRRSMEMWVDRARKSTSWARPSPCLPPSPTPRSASVARPESLFGCCRYRRPRPLPS